MTGGQNDRWTESQEDRRRGEQVDTTVEKRGKSQGCAPRHAWIFITREEVTLNDKHCSLPRYGFFYE